MELPSTALRAPSIVTECVEAIAEDAKTTAIFGRARDFEDLRLRRSLSELWTSGLGPDQVRTLGAMTWLQSLVVHDWRVPTLESLSALAHLRTLRIAGSTRLQRLDGLQHLKSLTDLTLFDCCNYTHVTQIEAIVGLNTLCLEGGFSKPLRLESLSPLAKLVHLRRLRLASLRVEDQSLRPLHGLAGLRDVFIARTFPDTELRAMAAALPLARGAWLDACRTEERR
jgi:hypothetical protein